MIFLEKVEFKHDQVSMIGESEISQPQFTHIYFWNLLTII